MVVKYSFPRDWDNDVKMLSVNGKPTEFGVQRYSLRTPGHYRYKVISPDQSVFDNKDKIFDDDYVALGSDWWTGVRCHTINAYRRYHAKQSS